MALLPMNLLNQFSYPLIGFGVFAVSYVALARYFKVRWYITTLAQIAIALVFIAGFLLLRPGESDVRSSDEALSQIGNGRPTLLAFYSNYCTGCLAVNGQVDELEQELADEFNVLRVDIHTQAGRSLRQALGFSFTPEFVLFDAIGSEVWRDHVPPGQAELNLARGSDVG